MPAYRCSTHTVMPRSTTRETVTATDLTSRLAM